MNKINNNNRDELGKVSLIMTRALKGARFHEDNRFYKLATILYKKFHIQSCDLAQDCWFYYIENDLHNKWDRKCKLSTYVLGILYNYLRNRSRMSKAKAYSMDALDLPRSRIDDYDKIIDNNPDDQADIKEYDFYRSETPESLYLYAEATDKIKGIFSELDRKVLFDEILAKDAASILGIRADAYRKQLQRKIRQVLDFIECEK